MDPIITPTRPSPLSSPALSAGSVIAVPTYTKPKLLKSTLETPVSNKQLISTIIHINTCVFGLNQV